MNFHQLQAVDGLMHQGLQQGVFPGAVLLVAHRRHILLLEAYGWANLLTRTPVHADTCFDVASLTKVLVTTLAMMHLISRGRLTLSTRLGDVLEAPPDKAAITMAQLLEHTSGYPDHRPYYAELVRYAVAERKTMLWQRLLAEPLTARPGQRVCYSDLGFLLLQRVIESVCDCSLGDVAQRLFQELELPLFFFPPALPLKHLYDIAATELCSWRKRLLWGEVHDENAWSLQELCGHAGLFASAAAVYQLLDRLEQSRHGDAAGLLNPGVVQEFWRRRPGSGRALGFDCPAASGSSAGRFLAPSSVGHLGFTGSSFWMDSTRRLVVILLTNRVHLTRAELRIRAFRPRLHDRIVCSLNLV